MDTASREQVPGVDDPQKKIWARTSGRWSNSKAAGRVGASGSFARGLVLVLGSSQQGSARAGLRQLSMDRFAGLAKEASKRASTWPETGEAAVQAALAPALNRLEG